MDLRELGNVNPERHWYYSSKAVAVCEALGAKNLSNLRVLEIGAGSGFFAKVVAHLPQVEKVVAYDPYFADADLGVRDGVTYTREPPHRKTKEFDSVMMLDVLEHVSDDVGFLSEFVSSAEDGTRFVITVPAFMSMWSHHDVFLGHYRRYRKSDLQRVVAESGLSLLESRYLFATILPIAWIKRRFGSRNGSDLRESPWLLNALLTVVCSFEHRTKQTLLPGLSVIAVAVKRDGIAHSS